MLFKSALVFYLGFSTLQFLYATTALTITLQDKLFQQFNSLDLLLSPRYKFNSGRRFLLNSEKHSGKNQQSRMKLHPSLQARIHRASLGGSHLLRPRKSKNQLRISLQAMKQNETR